MKEILFQRKRCPVTLSIQIFLRGIILAFMAVTFNAATAPIASFAGGRSAPLEVELVDGDVVCMEITGILDGGDSGSGKPFLLQMSVNEVLRGDHSLAKNTIKMRRTSRITEVSDTGGPTKYYPITVPAIGKKYIGVLYKNPDGIYSELTDSYDFNEAKLDSVKRRILELSGVKKDFHKEAMRVDQQKLATAQVQFYKSCLKADLNPLVGRSTDIVVVSTKFFPLCDGRWNYDVKQRLRDSGRPEVQAFSRPLYIGQAVYPGHFSGAYKNGAIMLLVSSPAAHNWKIPKGWPKMFARDDMNQEYCKLTFTYYPVSDRLWILPNTPEMVAKVKAAMRSSSKITIPEHFDERWNDPILWSMWRWPGSPHLWSKPGTKAPTWSWVLGLYEKAFGRDTGETLNILEHVAKDLAVANEPQRLSQINSRIEKMKSDTNARQSKNSQNLFGPYFLW